jgi:agmatinase
MNVSAPIRPVGSFFNAPVGDLDDLRPEMIALTGVYCDHFSGGTPGGRLAARQMRYASSGKAISLDTDNMVDIGDLNVFPLDPAGNEAILAEQCTRILAPGAGLIAFGGDYSVSPALFAGFHAASLGKSVGLIRISKRLDLCVVTQNSPRRDAATTRIASQIPNGLTNVALLGATGLQSTEEYERATGALFVPRAKLYDQSDSSLSACRAQMMDLCDAIYLSVDADALNPWLSRTAIRSGDRGISTEQLLAMLKMLQGLPVRAADLTGHLPDLDLPGQISSASNAVIGYALAEILRAATR